MVKWSRILRTIGPKVLVAGFIGISVFGFFSLLVNLTLAISDLLLHRNLDPLFILLCSVVLVAAAGKTDSRQSRKVLAISSLGASVVAVVIESSNMWWIDLNILIYCLEFLFVLVTVLPLIHTIVRVRVLSQRQTSSSDAEDVYACLKGRLAAYLTLLLFLGLDAVIVCCICALHHQRLEKLFHFHNSWTCALTCLIPGTISWVVFYCASQRPNSQRNLLLSVQKRLESRLFNYIHEQEYIFTSVLFLMKLVIVDRVWHSFWWWKFSHVGIEIGVIAFELFILGYFFFRLIEYVLQRSLDPYRIYQEMYDDLREKSLNVFYLDRSEYITVNAGASVGNDDEKERSREYLTRLGASEAEIELLPNKYCLQNIEVAAAACFAFPLSTVTMQDRLDIYPTWTQSVPGCIKLFDIKDATDQADPIDDFIKGADGFSIVLPVNTEGKEMYKAIGGEDPLCLRRNYLDSQRPNAFVMHSMFLDPHLQNISNWRSLALVAHFRHLCDMIKETSLSADDAFDIYFAITQRHAGKLMKELGFKKVEMSPTRPKHQRIYYTMYRFQWSPSILAEHESITKVESEQKTIDFARWIYRTAWNHHTA